MNEWPEGWFRRDPGAAGPQGGSASSGDPTVQVGPAAPLGADRAASSPAGSGQAGSGQAGSGQAGSGQAGSGQAGSGHGPASAWPEQPPVSSGGAGGGWRDDPGGAENLRGEGRGGGGWQGGGGPGRLRGWLRPRRIALVIAVVLALIVVGTVGTYFYLDSHLHRKNILTDYSGRPAAGAGQNWLITGSDSRQGLTRKQQRRLHTGHLSAASGRRSDTIMILHIPSNGGKPVLLSIPRDSYVPIPGLGSSKINAAFDAGGPKLLAKTVQNDTGLRINHYMGIGFGGFVGVVNDVGGVRMCLPKAMHDPKSGLHLKAGCHNLDGAQALALVRSRNFAISDLQRIQDQRLFVKALLKKVTSLGTVLNPFAALPAASGAASNLTVDKGTSLYDLIRVAFALRNPQTTTVPISTASYPTSDGIAVLWNRSQARRLFHDLRTDTKLPRSLITGSKLSGTASG